MDDVYRKPRLRRPLRQLVRAGMSAVFGLLVLVASALVLVWLFGREQEVRFHGIVDAGAENVGPVESARIVSVEVVPGQTVAAGDVLVRFDDGRMKAAVEILKEMAQTRQGICFTCQGREAEV